LAEEERQCSLARRGGGASSKSAAGTSHQTIKLRRKLN
jgi:hypothetical protein